MQLSILTETLNETLKGNEIDPHLIAFPLEQHYFEAWHQVNAEGN